VIDLLQGFWTELSKAEQNDVPTFFGQPDDVPPAQSVPDNDPTRQSPQHGCGQRGSVALVARVANKARAGGFDGE